MSAISRRAGKGAESPSDRKDTVPDSDKQTNGKTAQWACVAVKISSLRNEVKALEDAFVLHMFDMLLQTLLEPLGQRDRDSILKILKDCADPCT